MAPVAPGLHPGLALCSEPGTWSEEGDKRGPCAQEFLKMVQGFMKSMEVMLESRQWGWRDKEEMKSHRFLSLWGQSHRKGNYSGSSSDWSRCGYKFQERITQ